MPVLPPLTAADARRAGASAPPVLPGGRVLDASLHPTPDESLGEWLARLRVAAQAHVLARSREAAHHNKQRAVRQGRRPRVKPPGRIAIAALARWAGLGEKRWSELERQSVSRITESTMIRVAHASGLPLARVRQMAARSVELGHALAAAATGRKALPRPRVGRANPTHHERDHATRRQRAEHQAAVDPDVARLRAERLRRGDYVLGARSMYESLLLEAKAELDAWTAERDQPGGVYARKRASSLRGGTAGGAIVRAKAEARKQAAANAAGDTAGEPAGEVAA